MEANIVRFGELYEIPSSNGLSRPSAVRGEGFKMINMGELFANNIISNIPMERVQMSDKEQEKFFVKEGDLLFARQSLVAEGAGKCSIVKNFSEPTTFESHLIRVRLNKRSCDSWFYYYLFQLKSNPIKAIINQCAQAGIRGSELVRVKVPHPPLPTQQKIASILSAYDNLIQNSKKQIEDLQTTASELYKEWFVRFRFPGYKNTQFENGIPVGWRIDTVNKTFNIYDTDRIPLSSLDRDNMEKLYPYYGAAELMDYVDNYLFDGIYLLMGEDGSVITPEGTPVLQYVWGKFWVNNHAHVLKGKGVYSTEFLHLMFNQMDITGIVTGAAQPKISQGRLFKKKVVLPDDKIVSKFNEIIQPLYSKIRLLNTQITNLTQQRDLLLPRFMSGKIEIN